MEANVLPDDDCVKKAQAFIGMVSIYTTAILYIPCPLLQDTQGSFDQLNLISLFPALKRTGSTDCSVAVPTLWNKLLDGVVSTVGM